MRNALVEYIINKIVNFTDVDLSARIGNQLKSLAEREGKEKQTDSTQIEL